MLLEATSVVFFVGGENFMSDKNRNIETLKGTVTILTSDTTKAGTVSYTTLNGQATFVNFSTPNMTATNSTLLEVVNTTSPAGTVFSSGTKAESSAFSIGSGFPVYGPTSIIATSEGTESANKAIPYTIYYER